MGQFKNRVGEHYHNKYGDSFKIIAYRGCTDMDIEYANTAELLTAGGKNYVRQHIEFNDVDSFRMPFTRNKYRGYLGIGPYSTAKNLKAYSCWNNILSTCWEKPIHTYEPSWICFQIFCEWYYSQPFADSKEYNMVLSKDIFTKNMKHYSPETCAIVPLVIQRAINLQTNYRKKHKDLPMPIGVCQSRPMLDYCIGTVVEGTGKSRTHYYKGEDKKHIAFAKYKESKEQHIRNLADKYKHVITEKAYQALMRFTITKED